MTVVLTTFLGNVMTTHVNNDLHQVVGKLR